MPFLTWPFPTLDSEVAGIISKSYLKKKEPCQRGSHETFDMETAALVHFDICSVKINVSAWFLALTYFIKKMFVFGQ